MGSLLKRASIIELRTPPSGAAVLTMRPERSSCARAAAADIPVGKHSSRKGDHGRRRVHIFSAADRAVELAEKEAPGFHRHGTCC